MPSINMLSSADLVKGQGVGSAYYEQVNLVSIGLKEKYDVMINSKKRCDIIHFHTINPEYFLTANRDKKKSALVGYVHFLPETVEESLDIPKTGKKLFYKYMIEFYSSMDYLVTVNPYFIQALENYGIAREKVTYIPNYVSEELFFPEKEEIRLQLKRKWKIPEDRFIILGVGQVQTRKGVLDFVEIARQMPDAYFIWAGGFSFGPMTEGYKELKQVMTNPPDNVFFPGIVPREQMNDIYNICDVMFLPSYNELFPMTILESMCVRKPILLRDLDIYHDILFDYYLKGNSEIEFIEQLKKLKEDLNYYQLWSEKSYEGHQFYSKENVLKLWENFYDRVYEESSDKREKMGKTKKKIKKEGKDVKKIVLEQKKAEAESIAKLKERMYQEWKEEMKKLSKERDKLAEFFKGKK